MASAVEAFQVLQSLLAAEGRQCDVLLEQELARVTRGEQNGESATPKRSRPSSTESPPSEMNGRFEYMNRKSSGGFTISRVSHQDDDPNSRRKISRKSSSVTRKFFPWFMPPPPALPLKKPSCYGRQRPSSTLSMPAPSSSQSSSGRDTARRPTPTATSISTLTARPIAPSSQADDRPPESSPKLLPAMVACLPGPSRAAHRGHGSAVNVQEASESLGGMREEGRGEGEEMDVQQWEEEEEEEEEGGGEDSSYGDEETESEEEHEGALGDENGDGTRQRPQEEEEEEEEEEEMGPGLYSSRKGEASHSAPFYSDASGWGWGQTSDADHMVCLQIGGVKERAAGGCVGWGEGRLGNPGEESAPGLEAQVEGSQGQEQVHGRVEGYEEAKRNGCEGGCRAAEEGWDGHHMWPSFSEGQFLRLAMWQAGRAAQQERREQARYSEENKVAEEGQGVRGEEKDRKQVVWPDDAPQPTVIAEQQSRCMPDKGARNVGAQAGEARVVTVSTAAPCFMSVEGEQATSSVVGRSITTSMIHSTAATSTQNTLTHTPFCFTYGHASSDGMEEMKKTAAQVLCGLSLDSSRWSHAPASSSDVTQAPTMPTPLSRQSPGSLGLHAYLSHYASLAASSVPPTSSSPTSYAQAGQMGDAAPHAAVPGACQWTGGRDGNQ